MSQERGSGSNGLGIDRRVTGKAIEESSRQDFLGSFFVVLSSFNLDLREREKRAKMRGNETSRRAFSPESFPPTAPASAIQRERERVSEKERVSLQLCSPCGRGTRKKKAKAAATETNGPRRRSRRPGPRKSFLSAFFFFTEENLLGFSASSCFPFPRFFRFVRTCFWRRRRRIPNRTRAREKQQSGRFRLGREISARRSRSRCFSVAVRGGFSNSKLATTNSFRFPPARVSLAPAFDAVAVCKHSARGRETAKRTS